MRIGVDTGGTFTDCVVFSGSRLRILKVFSTPDDAARAIMEGVRQLRGGAPDSSLTLIHGTTVGTNTVLERRGARVALVTTAGFEDLIEIGRQARPSLYDLDVRREPPLVPSSRRFGLRERTIAGGRILAPLLPAELRRLAARIHRSHAESVAVCFLFSFANGAPERAVARALRGLGLPVSVACEILPEFREYERLSTVVINAYIAPRMRQYLSRLSPALRQPRDRIFVMQSNGGITPAVRAAREPVRTILSGPAGGVVAATWLARQLGVRQAISFDMGGTSCDVCLIDGEPRTTRETTLAGLPVATPVVDVHSVGAGGGSVARLDVGGALRVGPESAGAFPGPACYGRGGSQPTVTDANLLLGRLDPDFFLGGVWRLSSRASRRVMEQFLQNGKSTRAPTESRFETPLELARAIIRVANATMERALRVISVERGYDPRDFTLIGFGGAAGLHAAELARSLGMRRVVVPRHPGAFSALGVLVSDIVRDSCRSVVGSWPTVTAAQISDSAAWRRFLRQLERHLARLEAATRAQLDREGFAAERARAERFLDVRYVGQAYELTIPWTRRFPERFHAEHQKAYGHALAGQPLEIVNLRVRLTLKTRKPRPDLENHSRRTRWLPARWAAQIKPVWFDDRFWETRLYDRERLPAATRLAGPAIITEYSSTTVVPPDFVCHVDRMGNLILARR